MSPWLTERRLRRPGRDDGFTLIEVIVAIVILGIVAAGVTPLLVATARATVTAKLNSQAKQLVQEQLDRMRNLPFHVDASNGNFLDVLDYYYPNLTAAASASPLTVATANAGYVSTSARFAGEPASGAFYRYVVPNDAQFPTFRILVDTQFLVGDANGQRLVVTPPTGYDSTNTAGRDAPVSNLLGVTVVASWPAAGKTKSFHTYSEISDSTLAASQIAINSQVSAVQILSRTDSGTQLILNAASIGMDAGAATGTTATVNVAPAVAALSSGLSAAANGLTLSAPPSASAAATSDVAHDLTPWTCQYACFGISSVQGGKVSVANGLPAIGDPATSTPVSTDLAGTGAAASRGFSYSNSPSNSALHFQSGQPLVFLRDTSGSSSLAHAQNLTSSTAGATHAVTTTSKTRAAVLDLFPTDFTPAGQGVLEIVLTKASLTCTSGASGVSTSADWDATVSYWNGSSYQVLTGDHVKPGESAQLSSVDLSSITVGTDSAGVVHHLSDYVSAISGATSYSTTTSGQTISAKIPAVVSVTSTDTRSGDDSSQIAVQVGVLSCTATDAR